MGMSYPYQLINGEVLRREDARIPLNDLGLLRSYSIFEFFRVHSGVPVFIEDHLDRLFASAEFMELEPPWSRIEVLDMCHRLLQKNDNPTAAFRILLTGGYTADGYTPSTPNIYMLLNDLPRYLPEHYDPGCKVLSIPFQRAVPVVKTTDYIRSIQYRNEMRRRGAIELLYEWENVISECSRSNIFFVDKNRNIVTPERNVLSGITRKYVLRLASAEYNLIERDVTMHEIPLMAEAFLTSTTKGVMAVSRIDDIEIGGEGPVTKHLREKFAAHIREYEENYHWK